MLVKDLRSKGGKKKNKTKEERRQKREADTDKVAKDENQKGSEGSRWS